MNVPKFLEYGTVPAFLRVGKAQVDMTMRSLFISTTDIWQANITHEFYKAEMRGGDLKSTAFLPLTPRSSRREIFIGMGGERHMCSQSPGLHLYYLAWGTIRETGRL